MPRRSQQGGTEALYSLLEEESLARQKAVRRALKAESRAAKAEAEVEALKEVLLRQGRGGAPARTPEPLWDTLSPCVWSRVLSFLSPEQVAQVSLVSKSLYAASLHNVSWPEVQCERRSGAVVDLEDVNSAARPDSASSRLVGFVQFMCRGNRCRDVRKLRVYIPNDRPVYFEANLSSVMQLVRACGSLRALCFLNEHTARRLIDCLYEDEVLRERLAANLEHYAVRGTQNFVRYSISPTDASIGMLRHLTHLELPYGVRNDGRAHQSPVGFEIYQRLLLELPLETLSVENVLVDPRGMEPAEKKLRSSTLKHFIIRSQLTIFHYAGENDDDFRYAGEDDDDHSQELPHDAVFEFPNLQVMYVCGMKSIRGLHFGGLHGSRSTDLLLRCLQNTLKRTHTLLCGPMIQECEVDAYNNRSSSQYYSRQSIDSCIYPSTCPHEDSSYQECLRVMRARSPFYNRTTFKNGVEYKARLATMTTGYRLSAWHHQLMREKRALTHHHGMSLPRRDATDVPLLNKEQ
eukprot:1185435-Prorocentrum_minimum.AAC.1